MSQGSNCFCFFPWKMGCVYCHELERISVKARPNQIEPPHLNPSCSNLTGYWRAWGQEGVKPCGSRGGELQHWGAWPLPALGEHRAIRAGRNLHLALLGKQILCILQCSCGRANCRTALEMYIILSAAPAPPSVSSPMGQEIWNIYTH